MATTVTIVDGEILLMREHTLVNTVNCVGVMGRGVALFFKLKFRAMFADYVGRCRRGEVKPGVPYLYVDSSGTRIINFPTKDHWRNGSKLEWIDAGLLYIAEHVEEWGITSLALPPPGCGNGGLNWERDVRPLVELRLGHLGIPIFVCMPTKHD